MVLDVETERAAGRGDVDGARSRRRSPSPYVTAPWRAGQVGAARVVGAEHLRTGDLREVAVEAVDDRLERAVVVEVIDLDVREDRAEQRQLEVRAVALVGLDDEQVAARPLCAGARVGDVTADHEARPQPGLGERRASASTSWWSCRACRRRPPSGPARRSMPASRPGAGWGSRSRRRGASSMLLAGIAVDAVTASQPSTWDRSCPTCTVDAGRPHAVEHRLLAEVAAGDAVAHLGQGDGDGRHARTADADRRAGASGRTDPAARRGGTDGDVEAHDAFEARATRSINAGNASAPVDARPGCQAPAAHRVAGAPGAARSSSISGAEPVAARSRAAARRPPRRTASGRSCVWWSSADAAHGTRIAGVPVAATSATVLAPPRPTSRSVGRPQQIHAVLERRRPGATPVACRRGR